MDKPHDQAFAYDILKEAFPWNLLMLEEQIRALDDITGLNDTEKSINIYTIRPFYEDDSDSKRKEENKNF